MAKNLKNSTKYSSIMYILLFLSITINTLLLTVYFFKILPYNDMLSKKVEELSSQLGKEECTKVFSQSKGKIVCLSGDELKSLYLSECSKNFRENLNTDVLKGLKDIDDLEKLRELSIKMCMQEKGYDYK